MTELRRLKGKSRTDCHTVCETCPLHLTHPLGERWAATVISLRIIVDLSSEVQLLALLGTLRCWVPSRKATCLIFKVFGITRPGFDSTLSQSQGRHWAIYNIYRKPLFFPVWSFLSRIKHIFTLLFIVTLSSHLKGDLIFWWRQTCVIWHILTRQQNLRLWLETTGISSDFFDT